MTAAETVGKLCEKGSISISALARRIGYSPENLNKKLQRDTLTPDEMQSIAEANTRRCFVYTLKCAKGAISFQ